jgi:hypothetical protein
MRLALTLAAGVMLGGLGLAVDPASAAPAIPQPGLLDGGSNIEHVLHRGHHHYGRGRTTKHERMMRRHNTHHHGNPNARNPERPGYQQQLGNTTNGPRY